MSASALIERPAALERARPLRVLSISHSAVRNNAARLRYEALADDPSLDLTLMVPRHWHEPGVAEEAEPSHTTLKVEIAPVRLTRGGPAKWYLHHYPTLAARLRTLRPDVIHLWEEPWSLVALQAMRLRARLLPHAAVVLETDQNLLRRLPGPFERIRRYTLARADLLIARGQEALDVSRECGFAGPHGFVEYGIDVSRFRPRRAARVESRITDPALRLGYVGRLVPEKGLSDVLAALASCPAPIRLEMLGDGPEKRALLAQAAALGLGDRVRVLPPRDAAGVAAFMAGLDALVLMSRTTRTWKEQFGRVIMEAHGCGVPVIGSSSGSIPAVVGQGGWIVPEGDVGALSALLSRLAEGSFAAMDRAGEVGCAEARRRFAFSAVSADLHASWRRAAAARRDRAG